MVTPVPLMSVKSDKPTQPGSCTVHMPEDFLFLAMNARQDRERCSIVRQMPAPSAG